MSEKCQARGCKRARDIIKFKKNHETVYLCKHHYNDLIEKFPKADVHFARFWLGVED
jgi:hypothetical protein